jgi:preprotein translocase subunit Sec63
MNSFTSGYKTYNPETEGYGNSSQWRRTFRQRMSPDEAQRILDEDDPLIILGITGYPHKKVIKDAYRKMAMKYHPDRNPDDIEGSTKKMQKINAAYDYLMCNFEY